MNILYWLRARYPHLFSESKEVVVIENCLCNLFSEIRKKEETTLPRISDDFNKRLLKSLQNEKIEQPQASYSIMRSLTQNRNLQYSLSAVMVVSVAFVLVSRFSPQESISKDSTGVVLEHSSYLNEPASINVSESYEKKMLIDHMKQEPSTISGMRDLETYYMKTGRTSAAQEVHYLIEAAER